MQHENVISLKVLKTRGDIIGIKRPVQLSEDTVKPFSASNAKGTLRIVETYEDARAIASGSAALFMAAMS